MPGGALIFALSAKRKIMIKIFYGADRVHAKTAIQDFLGESYEIIDGADLTPEDLPNIFLGNSLFSNSRSILLRDLFSNQLVAQKLPEFLNTPHKIVIFELFLDKRLQIYKILKDKIEIKEFALPKNPNQNLIFNIYRVAKTDGKKAIQLLESIKFSEDPHLFFGLLVSQALKDFQQKQGTKEKKVLKELSSLDLEIKSTSLSAWLLIESFLLRLSSL